MIKFLYRIILFITFTIYLVGYQLISFFEMLAFVFIGKESVVFVSVKYKKLFMSKFFAPLFNKSIIQVKFSNPLVGGKFRNSRCPCGSQLKVKACHGKDSFVSREEARDIARMFALLKKEL